MGTAMKIIQDDSLRVVEGGYEVQVRLNWYRSLPLSCVEKVTLALDGKPVDSEKIRFGINGHEYKLEELDDLVEEFWFVQDSAILRVLQPGAVTKGETHTVEVEITLRFPYIPVGSGKFLTTPTKYATTQVAA
jgi:hypothetical protein